MAIKVHKNDLDIDTWTPLSYDPWTGITTVMGTSSKNPGRQEIRYTADLADTIEINKQTYNDADPKAQIRAGGWHVAEIPPVVAMQWAKEAGVKFDPSYSDPKFYEVVKRKLLDPDWRAFRTSPGNF